MVEKSNETLTGKVSLWEMFWVFFKIGAFTFGGGLAMIQLVVEEITKKGWAKEDEMQDLVVLAQSAPGIFAVNMAIFTGNKLRGMKGSLIATLGSVLPSFITVLLISMVFMDFKDNPVIVRIFNGIRPVAISLILIPAINMAKYGCKNWWSWGLAILTLFLVAFLKVSPIWIIIAVLLGGTAIALLGSKKADKDKKEDGK